MSARKPTVEPDSPEPVMCQARSRSGLYCEEPGDDGHQVHTAHDGQMIRNWTAPAVLNHAREAQLFAGYLTGAAYSTERQLDHVTSLLEQAELHRAALVEKARKDGLSWSKIGDAMGMSKQRAQQRYGAKTATQPDPDQPALVEVAPRS